jgi:hypothetical protein
MLRIWQKLQNIAKNSKKLTLKIWQKWQKNDKSCAGRSQLYETVSAKIYR